MKKEMEETDMPMMMEDESKTSSKAKAKAKAKAKDEFTPEELDSFSPINEYLDGLSEREQIYALDYLKDKTGEAHTDKINDHDEDNDDSGKEETDTMAEFAKYKENYK